MISERDKIEQLKCDLKSYRFYNAKIAEYDEELEEIAVCLQGVKAVRYDIAHGSNVHRGDNRMYWIMQEAKLVDERKCTLMPFAKSRLLLKERMIRQELCWSKCLSIAKTMMMWQKKWESIEGHYIGNWTMLYGS